MGYLPMIIISKAVLIMMAIANRPIVCHLLRQIHYIIRKEFTSVRIKTDHLL